MVECEAQRSHVRRWPEDLLRFDVGVHEFGCEELVSASLDVQRLVVLIVKRRQSEVNEDSLTTTTYHDVIRFDVLVNDSDNFVTVMHGLEHINGVEARRPGLDAFSNYRVFLPLKLFFHCLFRHKKKTNEHIKFGKASCD